MNLPQECISLGALLESELLANTPNHEIPVSADHSENPKFSEPVRKIQPPKPRARPKTEIQFHPKQTYKRPNPNAQIPKSQTAKGKLRFLFDRLIFEGQNFNQNQFRQKNPQKEVKILKRDPKPSNIEKTGLIFQQKILSFGIYKNFGKFLKL